ncbi:hypothetical protein, partial [Rhizocola hellebori]|uniref:hypothetical protein n=1 Tax=Rhizocola hellebori TaxID=1392758 RepID=UPI0019454207
MVFRLFPTNSQLTTTTDTNGHYTAVATAGIYYLEYVTGTPPAPLGSIAIYNSTNQPRYDLTNNDLTQDFQLPTTTLTVTVKDGFGNPVSNAPVIINNNGNARFPLNPGDAANYYYGGPLRNGTTNTSGTATITTFNATYPAGQICATVTGNQICNTTP